MAGLLGLGCAIALGVLLYMGREYTAQTEPKWWWNALVGFGLATGVLGITSIVLSSGGPAGPPAPSPAAPRPPDPVEQPPAWGADAVEAAQTTGWAPVGEPAGDGPWLIDDTEAAGPETRPWRVVSDAEEAVEGVGQPPWPPPGPAFDEEPEPAMGGVAEPVPWDWAEPQRQEEPSPPAAVAWEEYTAVYRRVRRGWAVEVEEVPSCRVMAETLHEARQGVVDALRRGGHVTDGEAVVDDVELPPEAAQAIHMATSGGNPYHVTPVLSEAVTVLVDDLALDERDAAALLGVPERVVEEALEAFEPDGWDRPAEPGGPARMSAEPRAAGGDQGAGGEIAVEHVSPRHVAPSSRRAGGGAANPY